MYMCSYVGTFILVSPRCGPAYVYVRAQRLCVHRLTMGMPVSVWYVVEYVGFVRMYVCVCTRMGAKECGMKVFVCICCAHS
jgi:hypothetical protein